MALPKAIQKQVDEADAIEQMLANPEALPENTPEAITEPKVEAVVEPDAKTPAADTQDQWQTKYQVLEGKYRAEVPRLTQDLRQTQATLAELEKTLATLTEKAKEAPAPKKEEALITAKDLDAFGEDLVDFVKRGAKEVVRDELSALIGRLTAVERAVATVADLPKKVGEVVEKQAITEDEAFWRALAVQVPDWDVVDKDPRWIAHLDSKAKYVQGTHRQLAGIAVAEGNIEAIVELVNDWKALAGITAANASKEKTKNELEKQITPSKKSNVVTPSGEAKTYTWAEYDAAFDPRASRTMTPAEVTALQAEMETAYLEGRIV